VRAHVEQQIGLIADGKAQKDAVVAHTLEQFRAKFMFFVGHITRMDALFEASFSPLSSSGELRALRNVTAPVSLSSSQGAADCVGYCVGAAADCMLGRICSVCSGKVCICKPLHSTSRHPPLTQHSTLLACTLTSYTSTSCIPCSLCQLCVSPPQPQQCLRSVSCTDLLSIPAGKPMSMYGKCRQL
jgi:hypothetical protein